jgi:hypothetical protein
MTLKSDEVCRIQDSYGRLKSLRAVHRELGDYSLNTIKKYASLKHPVKENNIVRGLRNDNGLLIGTYIGMWLGDGTQFFEQSKYRIRICTDTSNKNLNEFVQWLLFELFGKKSSLLKEKGTKKGGVRFASKFIFFFALRYAKYDTHKTYTVRLRETACLYSEAFRLGCILGLMLSDGYLKLNARFNVVSPGLSRDMEELMAIEGFFPRRNIHSREKYGWKDLHMLTLRKRESKELLNLLDSTLRKIGYQKRFKEIKYDMSLGGFEPPTSRYLY